MKRKDLIINEIGYIIANNDMVGVIQKEIIRYVRDNYNTNMLRNFYKVKSIQRREQLGREVHLVTRWYYKRIFWIKFHETSKFVKY